ncbi:sodium:solute symporter [Parvularcula sp. LCG005]|uniref:sodium:solute symporter n=1 Tax=Parvularcula sp. LCG005 TaxID=3078805 RepID=UPI0029428AA7|nr:sodium:solute symporter [Parvularcula sp. LCG005]WOI52601.1 sodium:solute symporter [Parvularcula sp. LCG005]
MAFGLLDWTVLGLFMAALAGIVAWVALQKEEDTEDYFLAGRDAGWLAIGASIFASNIGSEHLIGLASSGAENGMAMAHWEFQSWIILILAWVFVPFYWRTQIFTTPEFLERRYSPTTRTFFSFISLVAYVLTKVSVTVFAGGLAIKEIFGIESMFGVDFFWIAALSLIVITGIYTVIGGMKAVLWTSVLQTPVLLLGSIIILFAGLTQLGGEAGLLEGFAEMKRINGDNMHLIRPMNDPDFPWPAVVGGSIIIGLWYWCTDQYIVQRVLSARDMKQARRGAIFGGYLKLFPVFIFLVPGMIAFAMSEKGMLDLSNGADTAFPIMVRELLPAGVKGVVLGGAIAALMSSLASLFNSSATLFTVDFYQRMVKDKSKQHYLAVGRWATIIVVVLGVAWVPVLQSGILGDSLYTALQRVQGLIAPSIVAVFFLGIFSKWITPTAGLVGLVAGFIAGMTVLVLQFSPSLAASNGFFEWVYAQNWLYHTCLLFAFTVILMVGVSFVTPRKSEALLAGLTFNSTSAEDKAEVKASWDIWDVVHSVAICGIIALVYIFFW